MRRVELLPTRDFEAGYAPGNLSNNAISIHKMVAVMSH